jgi:hypothetical protein
MKSTYVGAALDPDDFRNLGIKAAERETSKSAILRSLVHEFLTKEATRKTGRGGNFRKGAKI